MSSKNVLIVGLIPELVDFTSFPGMTAEKVRAGLAASEKTLTDMGYEASTLLVDRGETAEQVLIDSLKSSPPQCVAVGAGIRTVPDHFLLFEKLLNVIHKHAPQAVIAFNTNPGDTPAAVQRWL